MMINLNNIPTPQLMSIRKILVAGVPSIAESEVETIVQDNVEESEKLCDCTVLDDPEKEKNNMENIERVDALEKEVKALKDENESLSSSKAELEEKASQVDALTQELTGYKEELESLREFKRSAEEAAEKAERIKNIKTLLEEAEIETDVEAESEYWLSMSDDILKLTISKMGEMKKGAKASASIKVPQIPNEEINKVEVVRDGLRKMKSGEK